jgi:hypothetical protein
MGYDYDKAFRGAIRLSVQFRHLLGVSVGVSNACMVHGMVSESLLQGIIQVDRISDWFPFHRHVESIGCSILCPLVDDP